MTPEIEELIDELREKLVVTSSSFIKEKLNNENINSLVSVVLSSHLTSAFDLMKNLTKEDKVALSTVNKFIFSVVNYIGDLSFKINNETIR